MKLMVQNKTVVFQSIVAEEELTVTTVPHCAMTLVLVLAAVVTTVLFLCTSYREVCRAEPLCALKAEGRTTRTLV